MPERIDLLPDSPEQREFHPASLNKQESTHVSQVIPSDEWAWMMGVIAGGGHISTNGRIMFGTQIEQLRNAVILKGEKLFQRNHRLESNRNNRGKPVIVFQNREIAAELGNFTRDNYVMTAIERHDWLLHGDRFTWSFLEGIFETKGVIRRNSGNRFDSIFISVLFQREASFLSELLGRVGLTDPKIWESKHAREGVNKVAITSLEDVSLFARNVRSVIPEKEEVLAFYRNNDVDSQHKIYSREEVIREWLKAREILGHTPSWYSINQLRKLGLVQCSPEVFRRLFSQRGSGKDFKSAQENLEKMIVEQGITIVFDEVEIMRARAVFVESQPKKETRKRSKRISDEQIIQTWLKARDLLQRTPNSSDLIKLHKDGVINVTEFTFVARFGEDNTYASASAALEKLAKQRGAKEFLPVSKEPRIRITDEELINEWKRIVNILGRLPSFTDISIMKEKGDTLYSPTTYTIRFGKKKNNQATFRQARVKLANIISEGVPTADIKDLRPSATAYIKALTDEAVVAEWLRVRNMLGHIPSIPELNSLFRERETTITPRTYSSRFGLGKWTTAVAYLEELISHPDIYFSWDLNQNLRRYEEDFGLQIRYFPKIHRVSDEFEAAKRFNELIHRYSEPNFFPILISSSGRTLISSQQQTEYFDILNAEDIERNSTEPGIESSRDFLNWKQPEIRKTGGFV